jgi:transcription antitermination factor NusG
MELTQHQTITAQKRKATCSPDGDSRANVKNLTCATPFNSTTSRNNKSEKNNKDNKDANKNNPLPWFCIHLCGRSQSEREDTARLLDFIGDDVEVFYPVVEHTKHFKNRTKRLVRESLFPNYLFIRFPSDKTRHVTYTNGVGTIVHHAPDEPATVPQRDIDALFSLLPSTATGVTYNIITGSAASNTATGSATTIATTGTTNSTTGGVAIIHLDRSITRKFKTGSKVKILSGLFANSDGEILSLAPDHTRASILLTFLGDQRTISVSTDDIEAPEKDVRAYVVTRNRDA